MKQSKILVLLASLALMMSACSTENSTAEEDIDILPEVTIPSVLPVPTYEVTAPSNGLLFGNDNENILNWIKKIVSSTSKNKDYKKIQLTYQTLDQNNKPVKVSAIVTYPEGKAINRVYLVNHGTHLGNLMIPSNGIFIEESIASSGAICIFPDYIGLGDSEKHAELYLNAEVQGRTSTDALLVLLDYAKRKELIGNDFETYIMGYSQGGAASLATLRYIQSMPEAQQQELHLKKVYCGDGPYDLRGTFETYMSDYKQGKGMGLPAVIPMVLSSMFHSYAEETKDISYKDLFTTKAWLSGVPKAIYDNNASVLDVVALWMNFNLDDVLDMKYLNSHPEVLELMFELMDRQNLTKGWELKYPTHFIHANPDAVVPFSNYEAAEKGLKNEFFEGEVVEGNSDEAPLKQHGTCMSLFIKNATDGNF